MPLTETDINTLVDAMPFRRRDRWQQLADRLQAQTGETDAQTYSRLYKWAGINLKQLQFVLNTPDEVLFMSYVKRLVGVFMTITGYQKIFTAPEGKITIIKQMGFTNSNGADNGFYAYLTDFGGTQADSDYLPPTHKILQQNASYVFNCNISMKPGDFITINATQTFLSIVLFGL